MAVSYIGGGNRSIRRKPATCRKWLTNVITLLHRVHLVMWGIRTLVVLDTDCTIHMISTTMAPAFIQTRIHSQSIHAYHMVVMLFIGNKKKRKMTKIHNWHKKKGLQIDLQLSCRSILFTAGKVWILIACSLYLFDSSDYLWQVNKHRIQ